MIEHSAQAERIFKAVQEIAQPMRRLKSAWP
jgi:hypothetical protein